MSKKLYSYWLQANQIEKLRVEQYVNLDDRDDYAHVQGNSFTNEDGWLNGGVAINMQTVESTFILSTQKNVPW